MTGTESFDITITTTDEARRPIYASRPGLDSADLIEPDTQLRFFSLRIRNWLDIQRRPGTAAEPSSWPGCWMIRAQHSAGSLGAAVDQAHRWNVFVGFSVLAVLAAGMAVSWVLSRRAERLARQQMDFVAGVSHELRTPLAVICSAGDNLSEEVISEPGRIAKYGKVIRNEGRRLAEMLDNVLAFSRSHETNGRRDKVDLAETVRHSVDRNRAFAERKSVVVEIDCADNLPTIEADANALESAFGNLVSNAIKHGPESGRVAVRAVVDNGKDIVFSVRDQGEGIPGSDWEQLVQPFARGHDAVQSQTEGSGLGLSIVQRVADAHGGSLHHEVMSDGSVFTLRIPIVSGEDSSS